LLRKSLALARQSRPSWMLGTATYDLRTVSSLAKSVSTEGGCISSVCGARSFEGDVPWVWCDRGDVAPEKCCEPSARLADLTDCVRLCRERDLLRPDSERELVLADDRLVLTDSLKLLCREDRAEAVCFPTEALLLRAEPPAGAPNVEKLPMERTEERRGEREGLTGRLTC
jgi:hypothetical protein